MIDIEAAYREHARRLERLLAGRFQGVAPGEIEDACQEAWAITWRKREQVEPENVMAWLYVCATHALLAQLRRGRREQPCGDAPETASPLTLELACEARAALALIAELGPNQKRAIERQVAGPSYDEIAAELGRRYTWTNRHLTEGRRRLRELLA